MYHARRARADLRGSLGWAWAIAIVGFTITFASGWSAMDSWDPPRVGERPAVAKSDPVSFVKVIDPESHALRVADEASPSPLEQPALQTLLEHMARRSDMFIAVPLQAVAGWTTDGWSPERGVAVIAESPPWSGTGLVEEGVAHFWGSAAALGLATLPESWGTVPLVQVSAQVPQAAWVTGAGHDYRTGGDPLLVLHPQTAAQVGVDPAFTGAEVVRELTCYCSTDALVTVVAAMNEAEASNGGSRVFLTVDREGVVDLPDRSNRAVVSMTTYFLLVVAAIFLLFVWLGTLEFWRRARDAVRVERLSGASLTKLLLRQQTVIALTVTVPVVAGLVAQDLLFASTSDLPPWHEHLGLVVAALGLIVQLIAGYRPAAGLVRDSRRIAERAAG